MREVKNSRFLTSSSGLSLIEILVVTIILGILAGIVILNVPSISNQSVIRACKQDWNIVNNGLIAWLNDNPNFVNPGDAGLVDTDFSRKVPVSGDLVSLGYVKGLNNSSSIQSKYSIYLDIKTEGYSINVLQNGVSLSASDSSGSDSDCSKLRI